MLLSAVITLEAQQSTSLPPYLGRAGHALFLHLIRQADVGMAARLHEDSEAKPFTVSTLLGLTVARGGIALSPGQVCFLRFTTYETELSRLLANLVLPSLPPEVELEDSVFTLKGATLDPAGHPWAGQSCYEDLANRSLLDQKMGVGTPRLLFASPTTFRSRGRNIPLPLPGLVVGSLADRWNSFSPITVPTEVRRYAEECLGIARFSISTRLVEIAGGKQVGFVGNCSYVAIKHDPYWWRLVNLLADFAFYSGVGYKTTMGMGQARRLDNARPLPYRAGSHPKEGRRAAPGN